MKRVAGYPVSDIRAAVHGYLGFDRTAADTDVDASGRRTAGVQPDGRGGPTQSEYGYTSAAPPDAGEPQRAFGPDFLVSLRHGVMVTRRGQGAVQLPQGEEGWIRRDLDGTGRSFVVWFPEHGLETVVAADALA